MASGDQLLPTTMRVAALHGRGDLRTEDRPVPHPGRGEVLIRVGSVGICGSDVHYYRHGRIAQYVVRDPLILGHEASGVIVAVGDGVPGDRVGQRVALEPGVPCRVCRQCKVGRYNLCPDVQFFATPPVDGAFAEFVVLAADFAHPVPDTLSDDAAALIEPLSVGVWACHKATVGIGDTVVIAGAGPVGLLTAQVALAQGASRVVVSDISQDKLEVARRYGAIETVNTSRDSLDHLDGVADAFIDCSGAAQAIAMGLQTVRGAGTVVLVGMGADEVSIPIGLLQGRELTITGTFRYANTYPVAIRLVADGRIDLEGLVTGHFPLDQAEAALQSTSIPGTIKSVVHPGR